MKKLIEQIAKNCTWYKETNENYKGVAMERIAKLQSMLPHGSGIDSGCRIDVEKSGYQKVIIYFSFHHMEDGYYSGWSDYKLICTSDFSGLQLRIVGKDKDYLKDYLYDVFDEVLNREVEL